jgi:hypothetical protein
MTKLAAAIDRAVAREDKHILFLIKHERPNYRLMVWHIVEINQEAWNHPELQS